MPKFEATFESSAQQSTVDEAAWSEAQSWVGRDIKIVQYNTAATYDNIRHFALGIGDDNPLWLDPEHGRSSPFGTNLAQPAFLCSIFDSSIIPGLPGFAALRVGSDWVFHDVVRMDDRLAATATMKDTRLVESRRGGQRILQVGLSRYFRVEPSGDRTLVAELQNRSLRMPPRGSGTGSLEIPARPVYEYSEQELQDIERDVLAVRRRGAQERSWEEVAGGDSLGTVVKGPYTRMSMHCYYAGAAGSANYVAHDIWWRHRWLARNDPQALPSNGLPPEYFGGTGTTSLGHHDAAIAHSVGMPGVYDNGNQRTAMVQHLLTNWAGDLSFLESFSVEIERPVIEGDTIWITGTVADKSDQATVIPGTGRAAGLVTGTAVATNQLGQQVASATWAIRLPRR